MWLAVWERLNLTEVHFEEFGGEPNDAMDKLERIVGGRGGSTSWTNSKENVFMTEDEAQ